MIDPELKKELEVINGNLILLQEKGGWWKALLHGTMRGFGSIIGAALALAFIGWLLNIAGIIPAFQNEAKQWKNLIEQVQQRNIPNVKTIK